MKIIEITEAIFDSMLESAIFRDNQDEDAINQGKENYCDKFIIHHDHDIEVIDYRK